MPRVKITGKVVLITGASAGIGEACARVFAQEGCRLVLVARRQERLTSLRASIRDTYPDCSVHIAVADVRNNNDVERISTELPDEFKPVDIIINNAGLALGLDRLWEIPISDAETMIDTNVMGVVRLTKAFVPDMVSRGAGHIINVGSIAGYQGYPGGGVYAASKHAVRALTDALRMEVYDTPIRVSLISPGLVETEFSRVRFKGDEQRASHTYDGMEPLSSEDVADSVLFAAMQPPHVQVADILLLPTDQASSYHVHRNKK